MDRAAAIFEFCSQAVRSRTLTTITPMHLNTLLYAASLARAALRPFNGVDEASDHPKLDPSTVGRIYTFAAPSELSSHLNDVGKHAVESRLNIPGIDLDDVANGVWDKVKAEVTDAVDAAKKGVDEAATLAVKTFDGAVDAAKKVINDVKDAVEEIWEEVKKKVAELEEEVTTAIHDWINEHIIEPLKQLLLILLLPFVILFLWCGLYHVAKPFDTRTERKNPENSVELGDLDEYSGKLVPPGRSTDGPPYRKSCIAEWVAHGVVWSWEGFVQGLLCLLCPWYGSFTLWRSRNAEKKRVRELGDCVNKLENRVKDLERQLRWFTARLIVPGDPEIIVGETRTELTGD